MTPPTPETRRAPRGFAMLTSRRFVLLAIRWLVLYLVIAAAIFATVVIADAIGLELVQNELPAIALVALAMAMPTVGAALLLQAPLRSYFQPQRAPAASELATVRKYSRMIAGASELDALVEAVGRALTEVLGTSSRSSLILVEEADDEATLNLIDRDGAGRLARISPIFQKLAVEQMPLTANELQNDPAYKSAPETERRFFTRSSVSAYAPVMVNNALLGIVASGNKGGVPTRRDLELLMTLAHQTGAPLRSARLVADLRRLNERTQGLFKTLEQAKEQVEKLDSVKTDFVTIASHELRTPLAQLRGYIDIIDTLNEQEMLDQDQVSNTLGNLRKATERMEELIAAMLDVSQIDVDAMDLRFAPTAVESAMRMAIEPLMEAVRQRRLTLTARGLRGLPLIQADLPRLVQAFRNVVVNAIKFTPDGGRIDISGSVKPAEGSESEFVLISIADTGVGIDPANLELIFKKFFRTSDPSLHSTGTYKFMGAGPGLGLTIARGVIEGHHGEIWAESTAHNMDTCPGSTFFIAIPVKQPEDERRVLSIEEQTSVTESKLRTRL
jgi:signal transduction histidine kinase